MALKSFFFRQRIRNKFLLANTAIFLLIVLTGGFFQILIVDEVVQTNMETSLRNSLESVRELIKTSAYVSMKHQLKVAAEIDRDVVDSFHRQYANEGVDEKTARINAGEMLLSQGIKAGGYLFCLDSNGTVMVHPEKALVGQNISNHAFVQQMIRRKEGYLEYTWRNPGEAEARPKAMYMTYYEPWDWIISVSVYRDNLFSMIQLDDLSEGVFSAGFGEFGYSFVLDSSGVMILHPTLQGIDILERDGPAFRKMEEMLKGTDGKIIYPWKNPEGDESGKRIAFYSRIPETRWIVASSGYMDEFGSFYRTLGNLAVFTLLVLLLLVFPITWRLSSTVARPLKGLMDRIGIEFHPDERALKDLETRDEFYLLELYFNSFISRLEHDRKILQEEINEREQTEEALKVSEEKYRSVMEATPDPIVVYDMQGHVLYLNPAFTRVFGWTFEECMNKKMDFFVPREHWEETCSGIEKIMAGEKHINIETSRYTKDNRKLEVSSHGAVYRDLNGTPIGCVVAHHDISDIRKLQREVLDIGDRERQRIGQDLHDDLGPHLIGIEGLIKAFRNKLPAEIRQEDELLEKVLSLMREGIQKARQLARGLCPVYLVDHGLESSLRELADTTESVFNIRCEFRCGKPVLFDDNIIATHMFRITQEAVNNAVKHGKANKIIIQLYKRDQKIHLKVKDDGVGLPAKFTSEGMGLRIMGFRAKMIDGALEIKSDRRKGTLVSLVMNQQNKAGNNLQS